MAKHIRNTANEQTFMKQSFHHDSNSQSYKQLKYDDAVTLAADDSGHEYSPQHQNMSSPSLQTLSASVANATISPAHNNGLSSSPSNKFGYNKINPQMYRNGTSSYLPNGTLNATMSPQTPQNPIGSTNGNSSYGHYAANISSANLMGSKKTLLDSSLSASRNPVHTGHQNTSQMQQANESQLDHLLSTSKAGLSLTDPSLSCSNPMCNGIRELLASLGLMCVLSLLMAFLALFFLQRSCPVSMLREEGPIASANISKLQPRSASATSQPHQFNQRIVANAREYQRVFQISVSLSTLTIALDLCCLFVCCIQFLSIVKLIKTPFGKRRSLEFIKKTSHIRVISIGAFLVSIPIFFTGVILYTFVNFDEIPALITSIIIGIGIIFCGVASVQNVYLWQWEKTKASQDMQMSQQAALRSGHQLIYTNGRVPAYPLELSTLV